MNVRRLLERIERVQAGIELNEQPDGIVYRHPRYSYVEETIQAAMRRAFSTAWNGGRII